MSKGLKDGGQLGYGYSDSQGKEEEKVILLSPAPFIAAFPLKKAGPSGNCFPATHTAGLCLARHWGGFQLLGCVLALFYMILPELLLEFPQTSLLHFLLTICRTPFV